MMVGGTRGLGTTSACAENTYWTMCLPRWKRNYLRVRGEYEVFIGLRSLVEELPPRARRIPLVTPVRGA